MGRPAAPEESPPIEALLFWAAQEDDRGLVYLDARHVIASWNAGASRITGYAASEVIGRPFAELATLPEDGVEETKELTRKDGSSVSVRITPSALARKGDALGRALILRDVEGTPTGAGWQAAYRACMDHAAEALFIHKNGVVVDVNRAACESLGYAREELIGMVPTEFDPDVTMSHCVELARTMKDGEVVSFDSRHRRKDGSVFPVEVKIRKFPKDGAPFGFVVVRDISERKRVEQEFRESEARYVATVAALRESEERFEFALRGANDGIWDWNLITDDVVFSTRWKSMLGYAESELADKVSTWRMLLHPDDRPSAEERVRQYLSNEIDKYEIEFRMAHKAGGYRSILSRGYLVWDNAGRPVRFVGTHVDITERKQAEVALKKSEEMLRRAQAIAHAASWSFHIPTATFTSSEEGKRLMGLGPEGTVADLILAVHPEDRDRVEAAWVAACRGAPYDIEHRLLIAGELKWVYARATMDLDEDGRPETIVGVTQDITSRRKLEEQFRQAQKMDAIGQLAGGIAHDFNNLLTVINCSAELMLEEMQAGSMRDELTEVLGAGTRAAELTQQLLAFSRKQILQARIVDLNVVVSRSEKMLRRLIGEDVRVVTLLDPALANIRADPGQIEQVILNLVVNARDAMPTGGILTIETKNTTSDEHDSTEVDAVPSGRYVELSVADTGMGISDELKAKIFEPFFSTKGVGKGTGLGLATVYGIVKQSDGHISVASQVGIGTKLAVLFPAALPSAVSTEPPVGMPVTYKGGETILLVEDEAAVRRIARVALEKQGYTVVEAAGGSEAVELSKLHRGAIHLLITDVVMPGMSGRQAADGIREHTPDLRVLFMSGYTDDAVVRHGVLAAMDHFLPKPFTPLSLVKKVREVLDAPEL